MFSLFCILVSSCLFGHRALGTKCITNVTNTNNVGHIYGNVFPAVMAPPSCNTFIYEQVQNTPLLKIMDQLKFSYELIPRRDFDSTKMISRSGSGFAYAEGFRVLKARINDYIASTCRCEKTNYNVTVFNRNTRGLHNFPRLLRRLDEEKLGLVRYFDSTRESNQCWYFCLYSTSKLVISVYGAESIYPFLTNTSLISVAYEDLSDQFLLKIRRSYSRTQNRKMQVTLVKASIIEEYYTKTCTTFWRDFSSYKKALAAVKIKPSPLLHKCISLYLDDSVIDQIIVYAKGIVQNQ